MRRRWISIQLPEQCTARDALLFCGLLQQISAALRDQFGEDMAHILFAHLAARDEEFEMPDESQLPFPWDEELEMPDESELPF